MGFNQNLFNVDFTERYPSVKAPLSAGDLMSGSQTAEKAFQSDVIKDPSGTVAGFAYNYGRKCDDLEVVRKTDYDAWCKGYDELESTITDNSRDLGYIEGVDVNARGAGQFTKRTVSGAAAARAFKHRDREIKLDDGTSVTWAQYRAHPELYGPQQTYGFTKEVMDARRGKMLGPDGQPDTGAMELMGVFTDRITKSGKDWEKNEDRLQMNQGANYAFKNLARFRKVAGDDGSRQLFQWIVDNHGESGGTQELLDASLAFLEDRASRGVVGDRYAEVANLTASMDNVMKATFMYPGRDKDLTPSEKRFAAVACIDAIRIAGGGVDFSNPQTTNAVARAANAFALAHVEGVDLFEERGGGSSVAKDLGEYIIQYSRTGVEPDGNLITRQIGARDHLNMLVTGGSDTTRVAAIPTGAVSALRNNMTARTGNKSSNEFADSAATTLVETTLKRIRPYMTRGVDEGQALTMLYNDKDAGPKYVAEIDAGLMSDCAFNGKGGADAAAILRNEFFRSLSEGRRFNVEDTISRLAFDSEVEKTSKDASKAFKAWYSTNVADAYLFADQATRTYQHLVGTYGKADQQRALSRVAELKRRAKSAFDHGLSAAAVNSIFENERKVGVALMPTGGKITPDGRVIYPNAGDAYAKLKDGMYRHEIVETASPVDLDEQVMIMNSAGQLVTIPWGLYSENPRAFDAYQSQMRKYRDETLRRDAARFSKAQNQAMSSGD